MAWGNSSNFATTHLTQGTDSPASAREDLRKALVELAVVCNNRGTASGVASLDAGTKIPATQIPDELNSSSGNNITLDPSTDKVKIEHILRLNPQTVAQLNARTDIEQGDIAFVSNGDAGSECLAVAVAEDDSAGNCTWKVVSIGVAISAT